MKNYTRGAIAAFLTTKAVAVALTEHHLGSGPASAVAAAIDNGDDPIDAICAVFDGEIIDTRDWVYVESVDWGEVVVNLDNGGWAFKLSCVVHRDGGDCGPSKRVTTEV